MASIPYLLDSDWSRSNGPTWGEDSLLHSLIACCTIQARQNEWDASREIMLAMLSWVSHNGNDEQVAIVCRSIAVFAKSTLRDDLCASLLDRIHDDANGVCKADLWTLAYMASVGLTSQGMEAFALKWVEQPVRDLREAAFLILSDRSLKGSSASAESLVRHIDHCEEHICSCVVPALEKHTANGEPAVDIVGKTSAATIASGVLDAVVKAGNKGIAVHESACKSLVRLESVGFEESMVGNVMHWAEQFLKEKSGQGEIENTMLFFDNLDIYLRSLADLVQIGVVQGVLSIPSGLPSLVCKLLQFPGYTDPLAAKLLVAHCAKAGHGREDFVSCFNAMERDKRILVARILTELARDDIIWCEVVPLLEQIANAETEPQAGCRRYACEALVEMAKRGAISEGVWDATCFLTSHEDSSLRCLAWSAIGGAWYNKEELDEKTATDALQVAQNDREATDVRLAACKVVLQSLRFGSVKAGLMQMLSDDDAPPFCPVRWFAYRGLAASGADFAYDSVASFMVEHTNTHYMRKSQDQALHAFIRRGWVKFDSLSPRRLAMIMQSAVIPNVGAAPRLGCLIQGGLTYSSLTYILNLIVAERVQCKLLRSLQTSSGLPNTLWEEIIKLIGLFHLDHVSLASCNNAAGE